MSNLVGPTPPPGDSSNRLATTAFVSSASSGTLVVGTTAITGGTTGKVLFDNAGVLGETTGGGGVINFNSVTNPSPVIGDFWFDGTDFNCRIGTSIYRFALILTSVLFNPTSLFSSNTGDWWDLSNRTSTFQNTAGTIPANAGDPVARVNGLSGNGNNLLQPTNGARPILQNSGSLWWLQFDGISQFIQSTFTINQPMTRISALRQMTWVLNNVIFDGGTISGAAVLQAFSTPALSVLAGAFLNQDFDCTVGADHVTTEVYNGALSNITVDNGIRVDGNAGTNNAGGLTIGANAIGSSFTNIRWYGGVEIGRLMTGTEISNCRTFFGSKAGLAL